MIPSSSIYEKTYSEGSIEKVLKTIKVSNSRSIYMIAEWLDLIFKTLHQERKRIKERISTRLIWLPWVVIILSLFKDILYAKFS